MKIRILGLVKFVSLGLAIMIGCVWAGFGQQMATKKEVQIFEKKILEAKWAFVFKDNDDDKSYFVDLANDFWLTDTQIIFTTKHVKRNIAVYVDIMGGCTRNTITEIRSFIRSPDGKNWSVTNLDSEDIEIQKVSKGTIGYKILNIACKSAKIIK